MRWLWTDDLAALLVQADHVDPLLVADWVTAPFAYRAGETDDPLMVARSLLGGDDARPEEAA